MKVKHKVLCHFYVLSRKMHILPMRRKICACEHFKAFLVHKCADSTLISRKPWTEHRQRKYPWCVQRTFKECQLVSEGGGLPFASCLYIYTFNLNLNRLLNSIYFSLTRLATLYLSRFSLNIALVRWRSSSEEKIDNLFSNKQLFHSS